METYYKWCDEKDMKAIGEYIKKNGHNKDCISSMDATRRCAHGINGNTDIDCEIGINIMIPYCCKNKYIDVLEHIFLCISEHNALFAKTTYNLIVKIKPSIYEIFSINNQE
jgi:hypothetical protein